MPRQSYRLKSFSTWQPEVNLHGIKVEDDGPVLPSLSALMELAEQNKWCSEFDWSEEDKKWTAIHSDMNQS